MNVCVWERLLMGRILRAAILAELGWVVLFGGVIGLTGPLNYLYFFFLSAFCFLLLSTTEDVVGPGYMIAVWCQGIQTNIVPIDMFNIWI